MRSLGLLILRLALGGILMAHGSQKVFGAFCQLMAGMHHSLPSILLHFSGNDVPPLA